MQLLKEYPMPPHLSSIKEVAVSFDIARYLCGLFYSKLAELERERNTDTATETGIARKEKCYGVKPFETDTLEERRFRIQMIEREINIYNFKEIESFIQAMCDGNAVVERDFSDSVNPKLKISVALASAKSFKEMTERVAKMLPVDMTLEAQIIYAKFSQYSDKTFEELSDKTFKEIKEV